MLWVCVRRLVERSQSVLSGSKGSKSRQSEPATSASSGHGHGHGHSRVRALLSSPACQRFTRFRGNISCT